MKNPRPRKEYCWLYQKLQRINFESITVEGDPTKFESSLEVDYFLDKLESHLYHFVLAPFFTVFLLLEHTLNNESDRLRNGRTINLLTNWDQIGESKSITTNQIAKTIERIQSFEDATSSSLIKDLD